MFIAEILLAVVVVLLLDEFWYPNLPRLNRTPLGDGLKDGKQILGEPRDYR